MRVEAVRDHGDAVLASLRVANHEFTTLEIDVFHPKPQGLQQPKPGSIEQHAHDPRSAG